MKMFTAIIAIVLGFSLQAYAKTPKPDPRDLDVSDAQALMTIDELNEAAAVDAILLTRIVASPPPKPVKVKGKAPAKKKTKGTKRPVV